MYSNTKNLIEAIALDLWPENPTIVDFGLESSDHLGAIQWAYKHEKVSKYQLNAALGNGPMLTKLVCTEDNPYRSVVFKTPWDDLPDEE